MFRIFRQPASLLLLFSLVGSIRADVRLPRIFGDGMVLQRDQDVAVWGWADPGESVSIAFSGRTATTVADDAGNWRVTLSPLPVAAEPRDLEVRGKNVVALRDVVVGDVWLCSGQSNMSISVGHFFARPEVKQDMASAAYPLIRHFGVKEHFANEVQADVEGKWMSCSPQTASQFCAVGFYFARKIHTETQVPIGIIRSAKGSTTIEMWLSQATLLESPAFEEFAVKMRESLQQWEREKSAAIGLGTRPDSPEFPPFPFGEKVRRPRCATLHNGMIAPLADLALRGVLWYQGEGNAGDVVEARRYLAKQQALVLAWRRQFRNAALPFYLVQLAAYREATDDPAGGDAWAWMRESQRGTLALPHTGMAVTLDIGDPDDIHPTNKADVGERLASWALKNEYGRKETTPCGPLFRKLTIEGDRARLHFDHVGAGLMIGRKSGRLPTTEDRDATLHRFAVAGADRKWHWAEAVLDYDTNTVVVHSPQVSVPAAVRYAFSANPAGANLYNRDGFPAAPFRTDDW